jgi:glycerol-3-phosphate acyltransferase PlsY
MTLVCDGLKGVLPMAITAAVLDKGDGGDIVVATGVAAVVGHMFPVYLGFRGGKGVATGLGVFLYLSPPTIAISLVVFLAAVRITGFVSVGSLLASALMPLWLYLFNASSRIILAAVVVAVLIWLKHHENISRLCHGTEKTWKKGKG